MPMVDSGLDRGLGQLYKIQVGFWWSRSISGASGVIISVARSSQAASLGIPSFILVQPHQ